MNQPGAQYAAPVPGPSTMDWAGQGVEKLTGMPGRSFLLSQGISLTIRPIQNEPRVYKVLW